MMEISCKLSKFHVLEYQARVILSVAKDPIKNAIQNNLLGSFATLRMTRWAWVLSTKINLICS